MVATKYAEGAFAVLSGGPTEVMEQLRLEGVTNSSRVVGFSNTNFASTRDVLVMYWTGGRKILANLVSWYNFNNNSIRSSAIAYDISDNANNGRLVSGAFLSGTGVDGTVSGALIISGVFSFGNTTFSGAHIIISSVDAFRSQQGTIAAWVYKYGGYNWFPSGANFNDGYNIFSFSRIDTATDKAFAKFQFSSGGTIQYYIKSGSVISCVLSGSNTGGDPTYVNQWTHVAVTCDGNMVRLYQNGEELCTATPGYWMGDLTTNGLWIASIATAVSGIAASDGGMRYLTRGQFYGMIDNLRIASYCMDASQIRELYLSKM